MRGRGNEGAEETSRWGESWRWLGSLRWAATTCVALVLMLGLQTLRSLSPQMAFLLRDRLGWNAWQIALFGLSLFSIGFAMAILARRLGLTRKWLLFAVTLPLTRFFSQLWEGDPIIDFCLASLGLVAFFLAFAALTSMLRAVSGGGGCLAVGWILGLLADGVYSGLNGSWDPIWHRDLRAVAVQLSILSLTFLVLGRFTSLWIRAGRPSGDLPAAAAWGWLGLGPALFLIDVQVANAPRYGLLLGQSSDLAWLLIAGYQMTALVIVTAWLRRGGSPGALLWAPTIFGLVALLWRPWPSGTLAAVQLFAGGLFVMCLLALILISIETGKAAPGARRLAWAHGGSMLIWGLFFLMHGGAFAVRLPIPNDRLFAIAAGALGLSALASAGLLHRFPTPARRGWRPWQAWGLFLALPALFASWRPPAPVETSASSETLRLVTFNVHCGISPWGELDLETMAQALEALDADLIALQEVTRGWSVNGSVDLAAWFSKRLGMSMAFAGTADPLWGNALLSRLPILETKSVSLPSEGLLLRRGILEATIDLSPLRGPGPRHQDPGGQTPSVGPLRLLITHLHHKSGGSSERQEQVRALIEEWQNSPRTVVLGDLNAKPESPEMQLLGQAGFVDAFASVASRDGGEVGLTFPSLSPVKRIDYIWLSPDIEVRQSQVLRTTASDHMPVMAEIALP